MRRELALMPVPCEDAAGAEIQEPTPTPEYAAEELAVGRKREGPRKPAYLPPEGGGGNRSWTSGKVPDFQLVRKGRLAAAVIHAGQVFAVGREHRRHDRVSMPLQHGDRLPGSCIPEPHRLVVAGGR